MNKSWIHKIISIVIEGIILSISRIVRKVRKVRIDMHKMILETSDN